MATVWQLGVYSGTYRKTGKAMTAGFAHLYRLNEGRSRAWSSM
jgi:hypothetical protein